jgi:hypothetical protein
LTCQSINVATISFQNLVVTPAANGTLSGLTGTSITFTPAAGYTGSDSFTFRGVRTTPTALVVTRARSTSRSRRRRCRWFSVLTASGTNGVPFSYQMLASNAPTAMPGCVAFRAQPEYSWPDHRDPVGGTSM